MASKTVWWDKNNDQHEGWIKDGTTYMDEAGTTRVPIGATVQTAGGTYKMTANGGIPTYATAQNQYEQKSNAAINAYNAAGKVQEERINSATNAAIAEINRQKQITEQNRVDADKAAKEAYLKAANPFGAMEEQRVRLGLDESGFAESSKLKLASAYAAQQTENIRAMNEQLRTLDVQIAQAKASGDYELANMMEARAQNILQQQMALQGNLFSGNMQAIGQAESTRQFDEQMAWQKEQADEQKRLEFAAALIEANAGGSAATIAQAFRVSETDVNALIAARKAQQVARVSGGGGGRYPGGNGNDGKSYVEQMLALGSDAAVSEWLIRNNFSDSEKTTLWGLYEEAKKKQNLASVETPANLASKYGSGYYAIYNQLRDLEKNGGSIASAIEILQNGSDNKMLTEAGYEELLKYFKKFFGFK